MHESGITEEQVIEENRQKAYQHSALVLKTAARIIMNTGKYGVPLKEDIIDLAQELNRIDGIYDSELTEMYLKDKADDENTAIILIKNKDSAIKKEPEIIDISEDMREMLPATLRDMAEKIRNYRPSA